MRKPGIIIYWWGVLLVLIVFTGCIRDESPGRSCKPEVELSFVFTDDVKGPGMYREVLYSRAPTVSDLYGVRYLVEIRDGDNIVLKRSISAVRFEDNGVTLNLALDGNKNYHVKAWADHVMAGDSADLFYDTSEPDLVGIVPDRYAISTDAKDAFSGELAFRIGPDENGVIKKNIPLRRPLAKFMIVATDLEKYCRTTEKRPKTIKIRYIQDLPLYWRSLNNPIRHFADDLTVTEAIAGFAETECVLAYDWVFAPDEETAVSVSFELFDGDGVLIVKSPVIAIPLMRNKLTIVKDEFLTTHYGGGIGIDDGFGGEIIIEL